jgi:uncharacterized phage protein (TIGR01671 family)
MREIKFRAWHLKEHKMLYAKSWAILRWQEEERQPIDIMQFTGLRDKNGKEIYDGDILRQYLKIGGKKLKRIGFVEYESGSFLFSKEGRDSYYVGNQFCIFEVIGNLYENPELL